MQTPAHLEPSKLGTKEYWDALYTTEISNHAANPNDTGTVWFDDSDAEAKLVAFLARWRKESNTPDSTAFLDLGCGNGSLLLALRAERWRGPMLGVDYSAQSVALAQRIAAQGPRQSQDSDSDDENDDENNDDGEYTPPEFLTWDILTSPLSPVLSDANRPNGWDVVLDKGTFDAISLNDERDASGRRICERYRDRVLRLVRPGGIFLITSCNWTEAELEAWFVGGVKGSSDEADTGNNDGGAFVVDGKVEYRSFSFGGVKGQTISSLCFKKTI